ncbi:MAG: cell division protein FtsQ/DivIB [Hyphomicrobiales bacterium]|nr:cell division protein FtsQ/DivIB [Alphaproteobacteria bacterium]
MDGGRRLAEPVTDGAHMRPATGAVPVWRRVGARLRFDFGRTRFARAMRRWFGPMLSWRIPRAAEIGAAVVFVLASGGYGAVRGGHIPAIVEELRDFRDAVANAAGFRIASIALAGERRLTREDILQLAGITGRSSLLFLDASEMRTRLRANPWIAEATVLKLFPGRLHITVTERDAFALWQRDGKVEVIAEDGAVVEKFSGQPFTGLPLVVGVGAETRAKEFLTLLEQYPAIRMQLHAAVLVAERRWNVMLKNGIDVRLPETNVEQALDALLKLDRESKILSRDVASIDLRLPDRVTVQLSDEAAAARAEALKAKPAKKKGGAA